MLDPLKIAVLWFIREHQPVSLNDLVRAVREDEQNAQLPAVFRTGAAMYLGRTGERYIQELIEAGLVQPQDGAAFSAAQKLVVTSRLAIVQDLFDISLTEKFSQPSAFVKAFPLFGEPLAKAGQAWARIFVAMPFQDDLKPVYSQHIRKVADELAVSCKRGDDFFSTHNIMDDVWSAIYHCDMCIVDCTGRNPNVFYELGIAHTLGRKTALIAQSLDDIPFDVRHLRIIIYQYTPPGMQQFEETLKKTIQHQLGLSG